MIGNEKVLSILRRLGLNQYESKVYLALLARGIASAGEVSEVADVPRSRVYDVLVSLEKRGLATIQDSKPVRYVPVEPAEIVNRVKLQYQKDLEEKVSNLKSLEDDIYKSLVPIYEKTFEAGPSAVSTILRGSENVQSKANQMIGSAKKSIHKITPEQGLINFSNNHLSSIKSASSRGISTRVLTHVGDKNRSQALELGSHAELRHLPDTRGRFLIKDSDESLFYLSSPESQEETGIWVKSPYLSKSLSQLFGHLWEKGTAL